MSNPPRAKGTRAESAVKRWLCDELGINVDRSPLRGTKDQGDILGLPDTVVEVKNTKLPDPKAWARELSAEMRNAGSSQGVVLWSPPGVGMANVDQWIAFEPWWGGVSLPQFGSLSVLHKYVALMDSHGHSVFVGNVGSPKASWLVARSAASWLAEWREVNLSKLVAW